jgi:membrane protease YdiL (CAAX protease family)
MFRQKLLSWAKTDLAVAVWLYGLLTGIRFIAEQFQPLWFLLLIAYMALPLVCIHKKNWHKIGLQKPSNLGFVAVGMLVAILIKAGTIALLFILFGNTSTNWMLAIAETFQRMPTQPPAVIGIIIFFMIGAPLVEEIFFRMFQSVFQARFGGLTAVVVSATLFGFAHIGEYLYPFSVIGIIARMIPVTVYGLVHAWVYHKTGSTYGSMLSHIAGNIGEAFLLILFILPVA